MIKARAHIVTTASGRATGTPTATARAAATGPLPASRARTAAEAAVAQAARTRQRNLLRYLRVRPEAPQTLVWLHPGNALEYEVESNTEWRIW